MIRVVGPEVSIAEVVREAQRHGGDVAVVPAGATKAESIDLFAEVLDFPDWFGRNLDALADCLHDYAEQGTEDGHALHLVWDGVAELRRTRPEVFEAITGVLEEVSAAHDTFGVTVLDR